MPASTRARVPGAKPTGAMLLAYCGVNFREFYLSASITVIYYMHVLHYDLTTD